MWAKLAESGNMANIVINIICIGENVVGLQWGREQSSLREAKSEDLLDLPPSAVPSLLFLARV
jgi:hypothetical protein